jgi:uncharacterized protein
MLSTFYEVVTGREPVMLRAYLLAVLVQMLAVNALAAVGYLTVNVPPSFGLITCIAGFVYGIGMVLAVGCAGAVFYRVGEGKLDYLYVVATFTLSAWFSNNWLARPVHSFFHSKGLSTTLHDALTVDRILLILIVVIAGVLWSIRGQVHAYKGGWTWPTTGLCIGVIGTAAWTVRALDGKPFGLGTMQGSDEFASLLLEGDLSAINGSLLMVVGIPLGSFIASRANGTSPGRPFSSKRIRHALAGGLLMGLSASLAAGDNILHGLSGVPILAVSSLSFMPFVILGIWAGVKLGWIK